MKTPLLIAIAAAAIALPATATADHYGPFPRYGCAPYGARPYCYTPYVPAPIIAFSFGSRPRVYSASRYYAPVQDSLEADVQRALRRRGYYDGAVDGDLGPVSRAAIREFQAEHGLPATGRIDERLLHALGI